MTNATALELLGLTLAHRGVAAADVALERGTTTILGAPAGPSAGALLDLVGGLDRPDSGTVLLEGDDITDLPARARSLRGVVRTFRRPGLSARHTALDNVVALQSAHGASVWDPLLRPGRVRDRDRRMREQAADALDTLGAEPISERPVAALSLGAARAVELAAALLRRPRLLLVEDPLADLDADGQDDVTGVLAALLDAVEPSTTVLVVGETLGGLVELADAIDAEPPFLHDADVVPA